jgi:hypothetical protein
MAAKKKNEEKALTTLASEYAVMKHTPAHLQEVISANVGGSVKQGDLDRIKVPAGGGTTWTIPSLDGEVETKEFDGVIVAWKEPRAYWVESFSSTGGGTPPDCSSEDSMLGVGDPGGDCLTCPFAQFGSATGDDGKPRDGQACRQMRLMAVIQQDDLVPLLLSAPPTSLQNLRRYFLRLASKAVPYYGVVSRFTLNKTKSKGGIDYAQIEANGVETLEPEDLDKMRAYAQALGSALERRPTVQEDYED